MRPAIRTQRLFRRLALLASLLALACLALAAPALAAQTHALKSSFGSFGNPNGIAVDASGDVYVADISNDTIQKFDGSGNPVNFTGLGSNTLDGSATPATAFGFPAGMYGNPAALAVDDTAGPSAGDLYVVDTGNHAVDKFDATTGAYLGQLTGTTFSHLGGVSVDTAGNVWVFDNNANSSCSGPVDKFDGAAANNFIATAFSWPFCGANAGFAVDSTDHVYGLYSYGYPQELTSTGSYVRTLDCCAVALATDLSNDHVYVDHGSYVAEYDSSGHPVVAQFGNAQLSAGSQGGIAVAPSGDVYVANPAAGKVEIYGPAVPIPDVTTGRPSNVTPTSAALNGSVNPDGVALTDCHFDYGTDTSYSAGSVACRDAGGNSVVGNNSSTPVAVHADVTGLTSGQTYHFRLVAANQNGTSDGQDVAFGPPAVDGESSTFSPQDISTSELVQARINPNGLDTTYHFEYGTTTSYGTSAPVPDADSGSGSGDVGVTQRISGLALNTTYHYRVVATNGAGTADGPDQTFATGKGFGVDSFAVRATNQDGSLDTQAGSHPYELATSIGFNVVPGTAGTATNAGTPIPEGNVRDIVTNLPAGLVGDPAGVPECTQQQLAGHYSVVQGQDVPDCPAASQVGVLRLRAGQVNETKAVYNMVPPRGEVAQFGINIRAVNSFIDFKLRTGGDYGVTATSSNLTELEALSSLRLTLWGVPADPSHDPQRSCPGQGDAAAGGASCPSGAPPIPLLTLPTSCTGALTTTLSVDSYQQPGQFLNYSYQSQDAPGDPVGTTGCSKLDFSPSISVQPDTTVADSPAGLAVDVHVPQNNDPLPEIFGGGTGSAPTGLDYSPLATANLRDATVTLPQGVSVNPSSANGLQACSPAQIGIDNANEPACPDASKVGSVEVDTPLLPNPLKGGVYVAQQHDNPFNSLLAIYVTAEDPVSGVLVKLAGHVVADPVTGQLTTTFDQNPQLPFTDFKLDFFGGPRGVLATPEGCGTHTTSAGFSPWSGTGEVTLSDSFQISSGCVSGFSPSFTAGTQNPQAGRYSPFVLSFQRSDTDQELSGLTVKLPPGVSAKLAGVALCSDAQLAAAAANSGAAEAANPSCPAGSQVGTVTTGAGPGPDLFFLGGKAYLTGPYKGAAYGMAVVVPVLAGPYDLGTVVVRQALYIDPTTAQVTAVSDPFPRILQGIPLRLRRIDVNLNRPNFVLNPTSCDPMSIGGVLSSTGGLSASFSPRFQVGGCQELGFSPKLSISLTGKGRTRSGAHPNLTATLTQGPGQANIRSAKVALPLSLALDPNNSQHVCSFATAAGVHGGAVGCPASTIVGEAVAQTPLLDKPLTGPVYLVQGIRCRTGQPTAQGTCASGTPIRTLPTLLVPLRGQIAIDLRASSSVNGAQQLVTTFNSIPDAPVSKFTLTINGGPSGLLVITGRGKSICTGPQVANAGFGAQSGKANAQNDTLTTPCGTPARLRVLSHKVKGHSLVLRVATSERGRLTVTGHGLRPFSRVVGAGVDTISVALKQSPHRRKRRARPAAVEVHVTLAPADAQGVTHTFGMRV